jgi:hypothetical protein
LPSQHVLFARPTPPPNSAGFAHCGSAKKVVVLHIRSDRNESSAAARSDGGCPQVVNEYRADRPSRSVTKIESGVGRACRRPLSEQAPGDIGENKEANDEQGARDDAAHTAWASLAPNQEPPLRLAARTMPKTKSSLP